MRNKFNAKKQIYKGMKFDSKKELTRYLVLEQMQKNNYISELELHPMIPLIVNGIKIGKYTADFKYKNNNGEVIIEDFSNNVDIQAYTSWGEENNGVKVKFSNGYKRIS